MKYADRNVTKMIFLLLFLLNAYSDIQRETALCSVDGVRITRTQTGINTAKCKTHYYHANSSEHNDMIITTKYACHTMNSYNLIAL